MSSSISKRLREVLPPYVAIGGLGGGFALCLFFLLSVFLGRNPLFADFLFWDVVLLSFAVFFAALNYHIRNAFRGYKVLQTIVLNVIATLPAILVFSTFLGFYLENFGLELVNEYKTYSITEIETHRESFRERELTDKDIDIYIEDIRNKTPKLMALDVAQKLLIASPFVVFLSFVLILLMHFVMILMRDRLNNKKNYGNEG